jgi:LacI family transcriptional regulator
MKLLETRCDAQSISSMPQPRVTLRDIAAETGFHFTTVGLALRASSQLPKATIEKVRTVADRLGYRPSPLLSALSSFRSHPQRTLTGIIGFLCTYDFRLVAETDVRAHRMFRAASAFADARGFKLEPIQIDLVDPNPAHVAAVLEARGIHGIILPPLMPRAGPFMNLAWDKFSVVGVGYSITNLRPHRVCFSHFQGMLLQLRKLRERGYERIGLTMNNEVNVRTGGNLLGALLAEQRGHDRRCWIEPCLVANATTDRKKIIEWIRREKPDCVLLDGAETFELIKAEGFRVPEDFGVALTSREDETSPIAGIDEQDEHLGEAAVDFVISLLCMDERALPQYPRYAMVEARWVYKPTVRLIAGDEVAELRTKIPA